MTSEELTEWLKTANIRCPLCDYSIYVYEDYDACCDNPHCDWYYFHKKFGYYRATPPG